MISTLSLAPSIFILSLFIGSVLSLIVGYRNDEFIWIPTSVTILVSLLLGAAVWVSVYFTRHLLLKKTIAPLIYSLSFGIMFGAGIIAGVINFLINPSAFFYSDNRTITFILISLLFFITINMIINGHIMYTYRLKANEKALHEEKVLKSQMELAQLTSKINPHFLFNSLSLILSLLKKPEQAETALINLAELLRYNLNVGDSQRVSLEAELNATEKYLSIQQMRFAGKLSYQIHNTRGGKFPPLLIQPLEENCIKHNIDLTDHLHIDLKIKKEEDKITLVVMDSEATVTPEMATKGLGLSVTKKRVELLGGEFQIQKGGVEISFAL